MSFQSPMPRESRFDNWRWWLPVVLFVIGVLPYSFTYLKHHPDERHYTDAALEMARTGDYLTPRTQNGELRFKKPILTYWIIAASHHLLGVSPLSSRLPFVLMAAAIIGLTYRLGLTVLQHRDGARLATLIVAFHPALVLSSSQSIPDIVLSLTILVSTLGFCDLFAARRTAFVSYALAYGGIGLAILAKGVPGVAYGVIAIVLSVWFRTWSDRQQRARHWLALSLTCVGTGAWFLLVIWRHGDAVIAEFLNDQVIERGNPGWWQPLVQVPLVFGLAAVSFLPWTGWLLIGGRPSWRGMLDQVRQNRGLQFLGIWSVVFLLLASCVNLVILRYQVVVTPALSILFAGRIMSLRAAVIEAGFHRQARLMTSLLAIGLVVSALFVVAWNGLSWGLSAFVVVTTVWVIWSWRVIPSCRWQAAGLCGAVAMSLLLSCGYFGFGAVYLPTFEDRVYRELQAQKLERETLWVIGKPAFPSRLRVASRGTMPIKFVRDHEYASFRATSYRDATAMLFAAHELPPEVASQFTVIKIPHGLEVKPPELYQSLVQGRLRDYLMSCQRSAYLAVRTSHLQSHSLATRPAGESTRN